MKIITMVLIVVFGATMALCADDGYTSMVRLVAVPEKYHGQNICVDGYFQIGDEICALFMSQESMECLRTKDAIWIRVEGNRKMLESLMLLKEKDVSLTGVFDVSDKGHMGAYSGSLKVDRIINHSTRIASGKKLEGRPSGSGKGATGK